MAEAQDASARARELLHACVVEQGFVAAASEVGNYRRVWSRDGVICGLAALVARDPSLIDAFETTLRTLARHQGRAGQLPSNVDPASDSVSYGGKAGRVDATLWFIVGACLLGRVGGRDAALSELWPALERALAVVRAWEFNARHLVYVPRAGDWADEYTLHGYVLYDQALRLWAWREAHGAAVRLGIPGAQGLAAEAAAVAERIATDFWPRSEQRVALYDPRVLAPCARPDRQHFLAAFEPGGAVDRFDGLGNALCCLLELGTRERRAATRLHAGTLVRHGLVPAFWPPIERADPEFAVLESVAGARFSAEPGRYHNGGLWPLVTAFWVLAFRAAGDGERAGALAAGIDVAAARGGWGFHEYYDAHSGEPAGVRLQAWSAAAVLLAAPCVQSAAESVLFTRGP